MPRSVQKPQDCRGQHGKMRPENGVSNRLLRVTTRLPESADIALGNISESVRGQCSIGATDSDCYAFPGIVLHDGWSTLWACRRFSVVCCKARLI